MKNLQIIDGNIMNLLKGKDAIVNPQNQYMKKGSGINKSIYEAAGERLLENFCQEYYQKDMVANEIRITPGFDLKMDIIHFYPPKFHFSEDPIEELRQGYLKLFAEIERNQYKNVIMPSLGVGIHGYMHQDVAEIIITEMKKFLENQNITITFVVSNKDIKKLYSKYL